jgi:membrane protease YdiL (CAAX protease family)
MTPAGYAAGGLEIAMWLAGAWMIWRHALSPGRRAERVPRLAEWRLPAIDFACYACSGLVGAVALSSIAGAATRRARLAQDATTVLGSAVMEGGFLLGIAAFHLLYARGRRAGAAGTDLRLAVRSGIATFLAALPLVVAVSYAWEYLLVRLGLPDEKQELVDILEKTGPGALRFGFIAVATVLVPLTEELVFRGGLFRFSRTRFPRWAAITATSVLFGALHVAWADHMAGLPTLAPLIVLAAIFCVAYERTGQIGTTVVAHALFNLNMIMLVLAGIGS